MNRLAVAADERPQLGGDEPEQVRGLDEHGVEGDDAPAEPVAPAADALQQPSDAQADEQLVGLRFRDLQLLGDRGRAPLRGVDAVQVKDPRGAAKRTQHSRSPSDTGPPTLKGAPKGVC